MGSWSLKNPQKSSTNLVEVPGLSTFVEEPGLPTLAEHRHSHYGCTATLPDGNCCPRFDHRCASLGSHPPAGLWFRSHCRTRESCCHRRDLFCMMNSLVLFAGPPVSCVEK